MSTAEKRRYSVAEYLKFERASDVKHEFYQGEIFAMGGASRAHNLITGNLVTSFNNYLHGRPCEVYSNDMRVKVDATGLYTYPDVTVVCGQPRLEDEVFDTLLNPKLIVEVLSESTEAYDRGQKFSHYQRIESFQEYVLVSQSEYRVEVFTREENNKWSYSYATGLESSATFHSINCELKLADIYRLVEIPESRQEQTNE